MPLPNRYFVSLPNGYYQHVDGSGPYSYNPATDTFTILGGGDASSGNQLTEIARLESIRDRLPASAALALTVTVATGAGSAAAGSKQLGFAVTGAGPATIASAAVPSGTSFTVEAPGVTTIGAVAYDATGTTLVVTRLA